MTEIFGGMPEPQNIGVDAAARARIDAMAANVKNFKCNDGQYVKGDGLHDDTTGIQNALNSLAQGGTLFFPEGTYMVTYNLCPRSHTRIIMSPNSVVTFPNGHDGTNKATKRSIFNLTLVEHVDIDGLTIDGNRTHVSGCYHCINITNSKHIDVHNCRLLNPQYDAVYIGGGSQYVSVFGNHSYNPGRSHYVITWATDIDIHDNVCEGSANSYVDLETNKATDIIKRVNIHHNLFAGIPNTAGVGVGCTGPSLPEDVNVESNIMLIDAPIGVFGGTNIHITNNICFGKVGKNKHLLEFRDNGTNSSIKDNILYVLPPADPSNPQIANAIRVRNPRNFEISSNIVLNSPYIGIYVDYHASVERFDTNLIVSKNTVLNSANSGISVDADGSIVSDNFIENSGYIGMVISSAHEVVGNSIKNSQNYGLLVSGAHNISLRGNLVDTNGYGGGIHLNRTSNATVSNNKVIAGQDGGIIVGSGCNNTQIIDNMIDSPKNKGIIQQQGAANAHIAGNIIKNANTSGIEVFGVGNTIVNNRCYDVRDKRQTKYGLHVRSGSDYNVIIGNDFRGTISGFLYESTSKNYKPNLSGNVSADIGSFNFISVYTINAPAKLAFTGVTKNSVSLSWTAPASLFADYIIEYKLSSSADWLLFNDNANTSTAVTVTGLAASSSYDFRVKATDGAVNSSASNVVTGLTKA